ncbi:MAG TPA: ABC transporter ATP-binding protein [Candidatus Eisenbacteria bacterium]|uniref:ABC transporter ATP-binding protein n=1 Tax=Eiseniibacteriota bacterium TaxID=2212470 RepID=A0A7V2AUV5_UNCEI|nr:ABC transporter ATP-binding protein [Candidatus Eisenbacteria bacterium]
MDKVLEVTGLTKRYRTFTLDGVTLEVPKGTILGLIGPNGAGKTTAIRSVMKMVRPDGGSIRVFGLGLDASEKEIKNRVGYVGEEQFYYGNKKVSWTGRFVSRYFEKWDQEMFDSLLEEFRLDPSQKVGKLSKGMKVKLSFAIAFSHHPELMILDEPTAGLDPVIRREMLDRLLAFRDDREGSVFISSHITDDIVRIADHVAFIVDGRVAIHAEKDEVLSDWKRLHFKPGAISGDIVTGLRCVEAHAFGSTGVTNRFRELEGRISAAVRAGDVKVENVDLDDVLIAFVKGGRS